MNFDSLALKKENLTFGVYYTVGSDVYWLQNAENVFRSLVSADSFSLHVFDKIFSLEEALNALDTYGFSDDAPVVIVKDPDYRYTDRDKTLLKNYACDGGYLLFVNSKLFAEKKRDDKKSGVIMTAEEKKSFNAINCAKSDKFVCARYAERMFPYGIESRAAELLAEYTDCDVARMSLEAAKLTDYAGERKVCVADIEELVVEDTDLQVFMFVNNIVAGKNDLAQKQLRRLKKRGETPSMLLASLVSQYRRMFYASISPLSDKELADMFKVKEFAIKKARESRKLSKKQLKNTLDMLVSYEYKFKSGIMSEQTAFDAAISGLIAKEIV